MTSEYFDSALDLTMFHRHYFLGGLRTRHYTHVWYLETGTHLVHLLICV